VSIARRAIGTSVDVVANRRPTGDEWLALQWAPPRRRWRTIPHGTRPDFRPGPTLADAVEEIDCRNEELGAFVAVERNPAGAGPILSVKDIIDVVGFPTRGGSSTYFEHPTVDGIAVARARAFGLRIIGKTETHEYALGVTTPQSRNPYDPNRLAGGSSGGSAIAVATGMCSLSIGTDTRASIRVPASLCGVVGFKATFGTVPVDHLIPLSWTMDHVCPIAATVADAALLHDVIARDRLADAANASVRGLRVGLVSGGLEGAEASVVESLDVAVRRLQSRDVEVVDVPRPSRDDLDTANAAGLIVSRCEAATWHRAHGTDLAECTAETRDQLEAAAAIPASDYLDAQRVRYQLASALVEEATRLGLDAWILPTTLVTAPLAEHAPRYLTVLSRNAIIWSFTGFPAISVPGPSVGTLPVGLQLAACPGEDRSVIALAAALET
jgi:aspartyl-tRNA(Asn)/glutamyl-tRNA(Gln) amidotransferase subunit A